MPLQPRWWDREPAFGPRPGSFIRLVRPTRARDTGNKAFSHGAARAGSGAWRGLHRPDLHGVHETDRMGHTAARRRRGGGKRHQQHTPPPPGQAGATRHKAPPPALVSARHARVRYAAATPAVTLAHLPCPAPRARRSPLAAPFDDRPARPAADAMRSAPIADQARGMRARCAQGRRHRGARRGAPRPARSTSAIMVR